MAKKHFYLVLFYGKIEVRIERHLACRSTLSNSADEVGQS